MSLTHRMAKVDVLRLAQLFKTQYFDKVDIFNRSPVTDIRPYILEMGSIPNVIIPMGYLE